MAEPLAYGFNLGNPDMHDMEYVLNRCAKAGKIYYGGIEKKESESLAEYFKRYLLASPKDGIKYLLLQYSCDKGVREQVADSWLKANQEI